MDDTQRLLEKLRKIEALFQGATTPGERNAAGLAHERIKTRLDEGRSAEPLVEFRFSFNNTWSRKLFAALLRRHNIQPYRYYRQRYTTIMARAAPSFVNETLWPQYLEMDEVLKQHLDALAEQVIRDSVWEDTSEPTEMKSLPPKGID